MLMFCLGFAVAAGFTLSDMEKWTAETTGEWSGRWIVRAELAFVAMIILGFFKP